MRQLENFTLKLVSDYLIGRIAEEKNISCKEARKLFVNALTYNVVVAAIYEQVDFLLEEEEGA